MQTFLPSPDFATSAQWLDWRRLGKQVEECHQILLSLKTGKGWWNHPAVQMWRNYEKGLIRYAEIMNDEWVRRGYQSRLNEERLFRENFKGSLMMPFWLGDERVHSSHRRALWYKVQLELDTCKLNLITFESHPREYQKAEKAFNKAYEMIQWYAQWNWSELLPAGEYFWPVQGVI